MRIYEIINEENNSSVGTLLYYEASRTFIIELEDYLDEWTAPLLFSGFVKRAIYSMPRELSKMWVTERIIPSGRQNISSILSTHKLREYDELKFLEISEGRCSQDSLYVQRIETLPSYVRSRMTYNLLDCTVLSDGSILCFFRDDTVRKIDLKELKDSGTEGIDKVLENRLLLESCKVGVDGFYLTFDDSIDIPAWALYEKGIEIPLKYSDFVGFVSKNTLDTSGSCDLLECSRQNIYYLAEKKEITPVKENVKGNLYLRKDIERARW